MSRTLALLDSVKILRFRKVWKLTRLTNCSLPVKISIHLAFRVLTLLSLYHVFACYWMLVLAASSAQWIPPVDWVSPADSAFNMQPLLLQHLQAFYYSIIAMLNVGETGPPSSLALLYSGASMVIGALVNAHLFGLMIAYIQYFSFRERRVLSKLMLAHNLIRDL